MQNNISLQIKCPPQHRSPPIFRLSGKTLKEWSEELHISTNKVLELLSWMLSTGIIRDIEFV